MFSLKVCKKSPILVRWKPKRDRDYINIVASIYVAEKKTLKFCLFQGHGQTG